MQFLQSAIICIGSTPFIQLGLMLLLGMSMRYAAGTTMLVIIPIALAGGAGYMKIGYLDLQLLLAVVIGTMSGSYVGA
ncbi:putative membrane protein YfcA [Paenibacillus tundrae]|uniref:Probable membrane transporter protein n=1 Tax=Paenibacillus tundrae TaxID=528187 RepID=A0ABT9W872_9BACL|nr:putative membrane protein YfcA [Paenibacillus tundrae]